MLPLRCIVHSMKSYKKSNLNRMFDAYDDFDGGCGDDDGVGGFHGDGVDEGPIDGDSTDNKIDDVDFLSQLLRHIEAELLLVVPRG